MQQTFVITEVIVFANVVSALHVKEKEKRLADSGAVFASNLSEDAAVIPRLVVMTA